MDETTKRMKPGKRVVIIVSVSAASLLIGAAAAAVVVDRGTPNMHGIGTASSYTAMMADLSGMERMLDPLAMERMHAQFPECQAMHAEMSGMMGSGMIGGSEMEAHHPSA